VVLDEVQHEPALFPAIKLAVDRARTPGRFLLTGSANVMLLPAIAESLAGRMEIVTLAPLSQGELAGMREGFIDALFAATFPRFAHGEPRRATLDRAIAGGYPEVLSRTSADARRRWFRAYTTTTLQREVRDIANVDAVADLPRLLSVLAARAGNMLNVAGLASDMGMAQTTVRRYLSLLQAAFLYEPLPPWSGGIEGRLVRTPKVMLNDPGIIAHLTGATLERLALDMPRAGALLESFVVCELRRQRAWAETPTQVSFFRTHGGIEVDVILEAADGRIAAIEVKAAATIGPADFKGLAHLRDALGERFVRGVLLHLGEQSLPFGERLSAAPVDTLWRTGARQALPVEPLR
jgi:hypothetical protein